jgi:hypothetical protein
LTPYTFNSGLQAIIALPLFLHFTDHRYIRTRFLSLHWSYPGNGFITVSLSLQITHEDLFAPPNSFLAMILQLPIPKTRPNENPLLQSSYPGRLAYRNSTVFSTELSLHGPRRKYSLSIVGKAYLERQCLAMNVYSYFTIPAFGHYVTIHCYVILEVCKLIFSRWDGTAIPISEITFNTGDFCSIRLPTQDMTFPHRC